MRRYSQKKRKSPKRASSSKSRKVKPHQAAAIAQLADSVSKTAANEQKIDDVKEELQKLRRRKGMKDILPWVAAAVVAMGVIGGGANYGIYGKEGKAYKRYKGVRDYKYRENAAAGRDYVWRGDARRDAWSNLKASPGRAYNLLRTPDRYVRRVRNSRKAMKSVGAPVMAPQYKDKAMTDDAVKKRKERSEKKLGAEADFVMDDLFSQSRGRYSVGRAPDSVRHSRASQRRRRRRSRSRSRSRR